MAAFLKPDVNRFAEIRAWKKGILIDDFLQNGPYIYRPGCM